MDAAGWISAHLKTGKETAQDLLGAAEGRISLLLSKAHCYLCIPGKLRWSMAVAGNPAKGKHGGGGVQGCAARLQKLELVYHPIAFCAQDSQGREIFNQILRNTVVASYKAGFTHCTALLPSPAGKWLLCPHPYLVRSIRAQSSR